MAVFAHSTRLGRGAGEPGRVILESKERLADEIASLLRSVREHTGARYAAVIEPGAIVFEDSAEPITALHDFLDPRTQLLFALPGAMAGDGPSEDVFEGWQEDEFFLAFVNDRVVVLLACDDAHAAQDRAMEPLRALVDRLFRYRERYSIDSKGRGLLLARPKLDLVVVGRRS